MKTKPNQGATARPWNLIQGKKLWHLETDADNPAGAGIAICSFTKARQADAEFVLMACNAHASLAALAAAVVRQGHVIDGDTLRMAKSALAAARGVK